jgi:enoyl-CoA hydratase/carnithine racemase
VPSENSRRSVSTASSSRRGVTRQLELDKPIIAAINGGAVGLEKRAPGFGQG